MPNLIIENAPEETVTALEAIAERTRQSVSDVVLSYLPKGVGPLRGPIGPTESEVDSTVLIRRMRDEVEGNALAPEEALRLVRAVRGAAPPDSVLPDSTPGIRADRDAR